MPLCLPRAETCPVQGMPDDTDAELLLQICTHYFNSLWTQHSLDDSVLHNLGPTYLTRLFNPVIHGLGDESSPSEVMTTKIKKCRQQTRMTVNNLSVAISHSARQPLGQTLWETLRKEAYARSSDYLLLWVCFGAFRCILLTHKSWLLYKPCTNLIAMMCDGQNYSLLVTFNLANSNKRIWREIQLCFPWHPFSWEPSTLWVTFMHAPSLSQSDVTSCALTELA